MVENLGPPNLVTNEVFAGSERRRNSRSPAAVVVDELAHTPRARREIARNQTSLVDLELYVRRTS